MALAAVGDLPLEPVTYSGASASPVPPAREPPRTAVVPATETATVEPGATAAAGRVVPGANRDSRVPATGPIGGSAGAARLSMEEVAASLPAAPLPASTFSSRDFIHATVVGPPPLPPEGETSGRALDGGKERHDTLMYASGVPFEERPSVGPAPKIAAPSLEELFPARPKEPDPEMEAARFGATPGAGDATQLTAEEDLGDDLGEERSAYLGKLIDERYLVKSLIGRGGMGAVYRVEQIHLRKQMAIKLLHENLVSRKQLVSRFTREARAISRLSSPHTVMVYDFGRWGEVFYLVMELLEGEPLDEVLNREGPLSADRTTAIVMQMCDSLAEAHKHGIVHRDLKPENIMLLANGPHPDFVKILDFGLAKVEDVDDPYTIHSQRDIFGTPHYMSPEQIRATDVDHRSDVYAVGSLMFRMLTGQQVFGQERNTFDILKAHLMEAPPTMADTVADLHIPEALEHIVAKAIEKKPDRRFQNMDELAAALVAARKSGFQDPGFEVAPREKAAGEKVEVGERDLAVIAALDSFSRETEKLVEDDEALGAHARRGRRRSALQFLGVCVAFVAAAAALIWALSGSSIGREQEPNDTAAQANQLDDAGQTRGSIGQRRSSMVADRDCYRLPPVQLTDDLSVQVDGVPNMDLLVTLHDAEGGELMRLSHRGYGQGEVLRHLDPRRGPAIVCVTENTGRGKVAGESLSDIYTLTAKVAPRVGVVETEPNDGHRRGELPAARSLLGVLDGPDDVDVFSLQDHFEGRIIRVHLESTQELSLEGVRIALLDHAGRPLTTTILGRRQLRGELAFAASHQQMPDRVVVHFTPGWKARWKSEGGQEVPYTLWYSLEELGDQNEREPNNTAGSAGNMVLGAWHIGNCEDAAGVDWLRIDAGDPKMRRIRLEANAPSGNAWWLIVRDMGSGVDLRKVEVSPTANDHDLLISGSGVGILLRVERMPPGQHGKRQGSRYRLRARWSLPEAGR